MAISAVSVTTLREAPPPRRQRLLQAAGAMIAIADRRVQGRIVPRVTLRVLTIGERNSSLPYSSTYQLNRVCSWVRVARATAGVPAFRLLPYLST